MTDTTDDQATATNPEAEEKSTTNEVNNTDSQAAKASTTEGAAADMTTANRSAATQLDPAKLGILNDVSLLVTIEIGRAQIKIRDLLNLSKGSVIELNKAAGEPVDIYANGKLISTGNIITANGKYCVRLASIPESGNIGVNENGK